MYRLSAEAEKIAERAGSARASARSFQNTPIFETLLLSPPRWCYRLALDSVKRRDRQVAAGLAGLQRSDTRRVFKGLDVAPAISLMDRHPPPMLAFPLTLIHAPMPLDDTKQLCT